MLKLMIVLVFYFCCVLFVPLKLMMLKQKLWNEEAILVVVLISCMTDISGIDLFRILRFYKHINWRYGQIVQGFKCLISM